jgi:hypothetical protein
MVRHRQQKGANATSSGRTHAPAPAQRAAALGLDGVQPPHARPSGMPECAAPKAAVGSNRHTDASTDSDSASSSGDGPGRRQLPGGGLQHVLDAVHDSESVGDDDGASVGSAGGALCLF